MTEMEDEVSPSADPEALRIRDFDVRNSVFVIPLDAPVPSELAEGTIPAGTLYKRLAALDQKEIPEFAFVPISGTELLALDRVWRVMQEAKKVYALFDLPGARYDTLFTQAVRQIGLVRVEWPAVADALASRVRTVQRTKDVEPWRMANPKSRAPVSQTGTDFDDAPLPVPPSDES